MKLSKVRSTKHMTCYSAGCPRCDDASTGHTIEFIHCLSSDTVQVVRDGDLVLCWSDDIFEALLDLIEEIRKE